MQFFQYSIRTTLPTAIGIGLPDDFAWSKQLPARAPLSGVEIAEKGQSWVDIMVTNSPGLYLYSEAVVKMVQEERFRGIDFFQLDISWVESSRLRAQRPWPCYYVGRITGRIGAFITTDKGEPPPSDEVTGLYRRRGATLYRGQLRPEMWDGSDFLYIDTFPSYCFCTSRVRVTVEQRKLRNFNFYSERDPNVFLV